MNKRKRTNPAQRNIHLGTELNQKLEGWADSEMRKPSELGKILIKWAIEQLEIAGSSIELVKRSIGEALYAPGEAAESPKNLGESKRQDT